MRIAGRRSGEVDVAIHACKQQGTICNCSTNSLVRISLANSSIETSLRSMPASMAGCFGRGRVSTKRMYGSGSITAPCQGRNCRAHARALCWKSGLFQKLPATTTIGCSRLYPACLPVAPHVKSSRAGRYCRTMGIVPSGVSTNDRHVVRLADGVIELRLRAGGELDRTLDDFHPWRQPRCAPAHDFRPARVLCDVLSCSLSRVGRMLQAHACTAAQKVVANA